MVTLVNRAKMSTSTTGTGTITLGSAESGYQSFADAGVSDGDVVRYAIEDGDDWEIGSGTYTASGTTLTRTVDESSNSDAALNLTGSAVVFITAAAEDIPSLYVDNWDGTTTQPTASGTNGVAIGTNAIASGTRSFAAGHSAASGTDSFAASITNNTGIYGATNTNSVALGFRAKANANQGTAIGWDSRVTGANGVAIGRNNAVYGASGAALGGVNNTVDSPGSWSTAIGGYGNTASSSWATTVGGYGNTASADYAVAMGQSSTASHANAIVLGDTASSSAINQITLGSTSDTVRISSAYTLPTSDGTNGQVLTTDGSGAVTFADAGGGGGADLYAANEVSVTAQPSATGDDAVAIGDSATASAANSMAIGHTASTSGSYSVAFGRNASSTSASAAAIGYNATASGTQSVALGNSSVASGTNALAGPNSTASGTNSFALGQSASASNFGGAAFGKGATTAVNNYNIAIGNSYTSGEDAFAAAIANNTSSYGATGANSIAIGQLARATQANSIAIGDTALSTTANLIALGGTTDTVQISGTYTLPTSDGTNGQVLTTDGSGAVTFADAGGGGGFGSDLTLDDKTANYTIVAGDAGKVITHSANSITVSLTAAATLGAGFHVWIKNRGAANSVTTIDPDGSETVDGRSIVYLYTGESTHLYTDGTKWYTIDRTIMFSGNTATDYYAPAKAAGAGSIAAGLQATADGSDAAAYGYNASASGTNSLSLGYSTFATGTRSTAIGNARASGSYSLAAAIASSSASYGATGANSIAMGQQSKSTAQYAIAMGYQCQATNTAGVALGYQAEAGQYAFAVGQGAIAEGRGSFALGYGAKAVERNKFAFSGPWYDSVGDRQGGYLVLARDTTDATASALTSSGTAASTDNQIILPNNSAFAFHGTIVARQQASAGTASAAWKVEGLIRREGSAGTTVLVNSATTVLDNTPGWGLALSADTTNGCLQITGTGAASTNIRWVATIHTSEVTYA